MKGRELHVSRERKDLELRAYKWQEFSHDGGEMELLLTLVEGLLRLYVYQSILSSQTSSKVGTIF